MAKFEDFFPAASKPESQTGDTLREGLFGPSVSRVGDNGTVAASASSNNDSGLISASRVGDKDGFVPVFDTSKVDTSGTLVPNWRVNVPGLQERVHPLDRWPKSGGGEQPGVNGVRLDDAGKPDFSRGPGGTIFQPRPGFGPNERDRVIAPVGGPAVAPIAIDTIPTPTGQPTGPRILPDTQKQWTPADRGTSGGLIDRNGDGKLEDERSFYEKSREEIRMLTFIAGIAIGFATGRARGAIFGAIVGGLTPNIIESVIQK